MSTQNLPRIPLPKSWNKHVRVSLLHVISLAQFAVAYTRGWAANSINPRLREKSELERLTGIVALLREEIRIKDARMGRISPHRRPQYQPASCQFVIADVKYCCQCVTAVAYDGKCLAQKSMDQDTSC